MDIFKMRLLIGALLTLVTMYVLWVNWHQPEDRSVVVYDGSLQNPARPDSVSDTALSASDDSDKAMSPIIALVPRQNMATYQKWILEPLDADAIGDGDKFRLPPREIGSFMDADAVTSASLSTSNRRGNPQIIGTTLSADAAPSTNADYREPRYIGEPMDPDEAQVNYQLIQEHRSTGALMDMNDHPKEGE